MKKSFATLFKHSLLLSTCAFTSSLYAEEKSLEAKVAELESRIETMGEQLENQKTPSFGDRVHFSGYGEMHVNQLQGRGGELDKKEIDFHRFVLGLHVNYTEKIRFVSELEVEHVVSSSSNKGEVALEQAYIEMDLNPQHHVKAGAFLIPIGIINETHEPPRFYGVERNPVERNILPATWFEGGLGMSGSIEHGWGYDVALTSGLSSDNTYNLRGGRQKISEAAMENPATTGRIRYKGIPGLEWSLSLQYQSDIRQAKGAKASASAFLYETHIDYRRGPVGIKALYAAWDIEGTSTVVGKEKQRGFYIEPSYLICKGLGIFYRYNNYDNAAGASGTTNKVQHDMGLNFWFHEDIVFKTDYQYQDNENGKDLNGINFGVGYAF